MNSFVRYAPFAFAAFLLLAPVANGATITYGNYDDLGDDSNHRPDTLLGEVITIGQTVELLSAGVIFRTSGFNVKIGIYSDTGGQPDQLIATTGPIAVTGTGRTEITLLTNPVVGPGDYWFMAVYDDWASVGFAITSGEVSWLDWDYAWALPATIDPGDVGFYNNQDLNYYLQTSAVPVPPAVWLFGSALGLLSWLRRCSSANRAARTS